MQELINHLASEGYLVDEVIPDGKIHRFGESAKKSNWYIAYQNFSTKTGQEYFVMVYGSWSSGDTKTYASNSDMMSAQDKKSVKKQIADARAKEESHRLQDQERTSVEIKNKWDNLQPTGSNPYIQRKGISNLENLDIRYQEDYAYVPMRDTSGKIWSLQSISGSGLKMFWPGGRVTGCFHIVGGSLDTSQTIYIAEGLATAGSIALATGKPVVVAFNAGNLPNVAAELKKKYPNKQFLICGDNDLWTVRNDIPCNPGKEKAEEAAKKCLGNYIIPTFKSLDTRPTDFNDLHLLEGLERVATQVIGVRIERAAVIALGFRDNEYFYTSSQNQQIVKMTTFSEAQFLHLMPLEYWEAAYPSSGQGRVDWMAARSKMMSEARKKGIFEARHVRGSGVWNDEGRTVVNMGSHLIVDQEIVAIDEIKSQYFYTLGKRMPEIHPDPLSLSECDTLLRACSSFNWQKQDSSFLLSGGLVIAKVCGALPIRPHLWITGGASTGKSTLLERLVFPVLNSSSLYFQGGTSEAGVRQSLAADACPVIFDEFETMGQRSSDSIQSIVELMRSSWSETNGFIAKGSAGGTANFYQLRFSAIVSSIRTNLPNDADRSRFAVLELAPHGSDLDHWDRLDAELAKIDPDYVARLFARTLRMVPILLENYRTIKAALAQKVSQRFGQQYGMLLAGYSILLSDDALTSDDAALLVAALALESEKEQAKIADHEECLTHLLTKKVSLLMKQGDRIETSIAEAINQAKTDPLLDEALQTIGVRVYSDSVFIAVRHTELKNQVFRGTQWVNWAESLARLKDAKKHVNQRISGHVQRCVKIPAILI